MPFPAHGAAARRDSKLLRIRKLSLWITGGATAASITLGAAFAYALPGHSYSSAPPTSSSGSSGTPGQRSPAAPVHATGGHSHRTRLAPPRQQPAPAPTQTQPVVTSGGS